LLTAACFSESAHALIDYPMKTSSSPFDVPLISKLGPLPCYLAFRYAPFSLLWLDEDAKWITTLSEKELHEFKNAPSIFSEPAVLGDGLRVAPSGIPNSGRGLFTTRFFRRGDLVTEYVGTRISRERALQLKALNLHSHIRSISFHELIDGERDPQELQGVGAMANDPRDVTKVNTKYHLVWDEANARFLVYLRALRDILMGEEVLVSYGKSYWR
jgi:hypothetical protein